MTTAIIVQARMTSSRFPGKVLRMLDGRTVLDRVLDRAQRVIGADMVVVACPRDDASKPIYEACRARGVPFFAGSELNVLFRYYRAAVKHNAEIIMRITSDCPFFNPLIAGEVLRKLRDEDLDYASNVFPHRTFPKGFDCEAFTFDCLEAAQLNARDDYDREHVTPWMQQTEGLNRGLLAQAKDFSNVNLCVDFPGDIERLETMMFRGEIPTLERIDRDGTRH